LLINTRFGKRELPIGLVLITLVLSAEGFKALETCLVETDPSLAV
jgi:hypothetical protein